jgi:DNA ligase (NAD+)
MNITELQTLIDKADNAYYTTGTSIMEDARYDKLKVELASLNPSDTRLLTVGNSVRDSILQKKTHSIPMGSQDKALNEGEFDAWIKSNNLDKTVLHASHKMDGGSFSLEYKGGRLVAAISRGDGMVGEDITANARKFKNIPPLVFANDGNLFTGFIRGEVVLSMEDWLEVDPSQSSNPRNLAVGIARRKDGSQSEYLKFYGFRMFDLDGELYGDSEEDLSTFLVKMGFDSAPFVIGKRNDIWKWYNSVYSNRPSLPYWIDGIVVKVNDLESQLKMGEAGNSCPKGQIAIKFEAEGGTSILRNVAYQVGGTGAIVPVANFDVVRIGGTNISNATLCNWDNIETLGVCIGDKIAVIKAGDIIPRIMEVVEHGKSRTPIPEPTTCPVCNGSVGRKSNVSGDESTTIYCLNSDCSAVVAGRIERYVKSLDIQGIGSNVIESMVRELGIKDSSELYTLHLNPQSLADLTLSGGGNLGQKRADKILIEIDKKRDLTLSDFLGSLGIFGLGKRRVTLIQEAVPVVFDALDNWFTNLLIQHAVKAGVPNIASRLNDELISQRDVIEKYITNGVTIQKPLPKHIARNGAHVICITGALSKPKSFFAALIHQRGDVYVDSFSKTVTHLVAADPNSGSAKLKKAEKQGTKLLSENDLISLLQSKV